jgi:tripartite-type tricarboxylate transporter receptor subunit TctC
MKKSLARTLALTLAIALATLVNTAGADAYPNRPVRIIVGYAAGGSVDIVARIVADKLSQRLGQRFIVDNQPGGGTIIASQALVKAAPDGHTLMLADIAHGANPALKEKLPYDTQKDFKPVVLVATLPAILAVEKSLPVKNVKELISYAKAKNGELNYSSSGLGSMNFLATEQLKIDTGIKLTHIPYQSGGQALNALLGGFVQVLITTAPPLLGHQEKVSILAVSSEKRLPALPNVPTFAESGLPEYKMQLWQGLLAPAGTDKEIVDKINKEFNAVLDLPDVRERISVLGAEIVGGSPDKLAAFIDQEIVKWKRVIPAELRTK